MSRPNNNNRGGMLKDKEKLIQEIISDSLKEGLPLSREEAEEIAEMEIKAKEVTNFVQSLNYKEKIQAKRKDLEKAELIARIYSLLSNDNETYTKLQIADAQKEITFEYNGNSYSLNLIKHRKAKG